MEQATSNLHHATFCPPIPSPILSSSPLSSSSSSPSSSSASSSSSSLISPLSSSSSSSPLVSLSSSALPSTNLPSLNQVLTTSSEATSSPINYNNNNNNINGPLTEQEFEEYYSQHYPHIRAYYGPEVPYVYIVEQPAKCGVRFRYECEGRISTAIPGMNASATRYTSPTIAIANYQGPVKVVVSCVTKNAPYRAHPHNLVGKKFCKDGISVSIFLESICEFSNLGILCAKRRDIRERFKLREELKIDPFKNGFIHKLQPFKSIDLSCLRLCFEVYLFDNVSGSFSHPLEPIVSEEIHDRKAVSELSIIRLSHDSSPITGGGNAILLCERVIKDDIQIRFFQEHQSIVVWHKLAEFSPNDIHKHFAISFRIPSYELPVAENQTITVHVQLYRPSDQAVSEILPFYYYYSSASTSLSSATSMSNSNSMSYNSSNSSNNNNTNSDNNNNSWNNTSTFYNDDDYCLFNNNNYS